MVWFGFFVWLWFVGLEDVTQIAQISAWASLKRIDRVSKPELELCPTL